MRRKPDRDSPSLSPRAAARALACLVLLGGTPAAADLVVFADGRVLKVSAYEVGGRKVQLTLPSGGHLTVPLGRIERIVDDELVPEGVVDEETFEPGPRLAFRDGDGVPETPFGELIYEAARRHELNPAVVAAMVAAESAFDPHAVSHKGARGLMQLMPATADRFGVRLGELFEPRRNLEAGVRYLRWLSERYPGELPLILAAYNAGEANVDRHGGVPPFRETRDYIRRIYSRLGLEVAPGSGL